MIDKKVACEKVRSKCAKWMAGGIKIHQSVGIKRERYGQLRLKVSEYRAVVQKHKEFLPKPSCGLKLHHLSSPRTVLTGSVYEVF